MKKYYKQAFILIAAALVVIFTASRYRVFKNPHITDNSNLPREDAASESATSESAASDTEEIEKETLKQIFGEWEVSKLIGFTEIQNDYTNAPDGHDIIGDRIIISEQKFSSKDIVQYERYQCEISDPVYSISEIKEQAIICPVDSVKEDFELYNMINNAYFQDLSAKDKFHKHAAVNIIIASDNHVILEIDGAFYLLNKVSS